MSAEIVETSRVFARTNANIEPQWLEDKARHLLKKNYFDPHWQQRQAQVSALEQASLYGLILYANRKVNYGPIDPEESRKLFIHHALVKQEFDCKEKFFIHNKKLIHEIKSLEAKSRRLDILIEEEDLFNYFDKIIPATVYNGPLFKQWFKQAKQAEKDKLFLNKDCLMQHDAANISNIMFPDFLSIEGMQFPLSYHFDTHHKQDGVTLTTPVSTLGAINPQRCEWLVPGLLHAKIVALIRSLPKSIRRNFVPAPNFADACFESMQVSDLSLCAALSLQLKKMTGIDIPYDAWQPQQLDTHYFFNFRVINNKGKTITEGRDLPALKDELSEFKQSDDIKIQNDIEQNNVDASILDSLPDSIEHISNGIKVIAYPALIKNGDKVSIKAMVSKHEAARATQQGLRQLFINALPSQIKFLRNNIPGIQNLCLKYASFGSCNTLKTEIIESVLDITFLSDKINSTNDFTCSLNKGKENLMGNCEKWCQTLEKILDEYRKVTKTLKQPPLHILDTVTDVQQQLANLFPKNFITTVDKKWIQHYPRFLKAINARLEKATRDATRDRQLRLQVSPLFKDFLQRDSLNKKNHVQSEQLEHYRWMLEEFRVSLFAQDLKTQFPVSEKRLKTYWRNISDS